ncbi:hypothetical protein [Candidatus Nitrosotenuis chungbukensis]|uniref:hypothetical protein n=2 Tax=Candidatus Nitrosotenuis chungbukensis TaxID=1353246 RepID=UPI0005B2DDBF|nr:hypothetical protein [Candidatus Nitrosotenuis chungbukensis]
MIFSEITSDLQAQLKSNLPQIRILLKKNPAMAYTKITEIGFAVGRKYKIQLIVNFPQRGKIEDFDSYGMQDLSIIIDRQKKNFPIQRSIIKDKAREIFGNVQIDDAYMYEGKEGVKVFPDGGRIDILPHSIHIWCKFDEKVTSYCNWLLINVYQMGQDSSFTSS